MIYKALLLTIIHFITSNLFCQNEKIEYIINQLDSIFITNYPKSNSEFNTSLSNKFLIFLSEIKNEDNSQELNITREVINAKKDYYNSELGFSIKTNYLDNQVSNFFDLEDNINYKRRLQTSLEWNLLKNGYIENKNKAKALEYNLMIQEYNLNSTFNKSIYLKRFNQTIVVFNTHKIEILNTRKNIINQLKKIENSLFTKKHINKEELLDTELRNAEIDGLFQIYETYNELSNLKSQSFLGQINTIPIFDLNYKYILKDLNTNKIDSLSKLFNKEFEILNQWYNKINLSIFSRYNYYQQVNITNTLQDRTFFSYGLNLSIPLNFNGNKEKNLNNIETKKKIEEISNRKLVYQEEILNEIYEFRYKLKQFISLYYNQQKIKDLIRIEEVKRKLNPANFSPIKGIKYIDDYLQTELELVDLKQNLYLKLIRIQNKIPDAKLDSMTIPFELIESNKTNLKNSKSIYIWSDIIEKYNVDFIIEYLVYNHFDKVIIAIKKDDIDLNKKNQLIQMLNQLNIQVSVMIGNNNLLNVSNINEEMNKYLDKLPLNLISSLHLDVEPHASVNWDVSKEYLLEKYTQMINLTKEYCKTKNLKFEISIPLHYPEDITKKLFENVDQIYFMCYENINSSYIEKKLSPFNSNEYKSKYTISLRTNDFNDRDQMEKYIDHLINNLKVNKIAYHNLKNILLFDEENINNEK